MKILNHLLKGGVGPLDAEDAEEIEQRPKQHITLE